MKYLVPRNKGGKTYYYWIPQKRYLIDGQWQETPKGLQQKALGTDAAKAVETAQLLYAELKRWRVGEEPAMHYARGTVGWLIGEYQQDDCFDAMTPASQTKYLGCLDILKEKCGDLPIDKLSRMAARSICLSLKAKSAPERMAGVGRVLYNFGKVLGVAKDNPFEGLRISRIRPRNSVWPIELIKAVQANADSSIALAIQLALDTGQRAGDLRTLTWAAYGGGKLRFKQSKTGAVVHVRVMKELTSMLDKADRKAPAVLICEETGKPYSKDMLSRRFRDACAGIEGAEKLQFRDLRRTAVVRLAEHGCTNAEIAAITGHSMSATTAILDVYLPRNSVMADNAIAKLEKPKT